MPVDAKRLERAREMEKMSLMSMEKEAVADEDEIVMSSTAYPGQEWAPEGLETYFEESAANVI
jgi:mRNA degradation ribonuclease J1/J2